MARLSEKAAERLHAEIVNETDTPRTRDLKLLRAKRLAYYERSGRTKISSFDIDNNPNYSRGAVLHLEESTKEEKNQTSTSSGSQQPNDAGNGRKLLIQISSGVNDQGKEEETVITSAETDCKCISQSYISELNHRLLEDPTVPETQILKHVKNWAQLFPSESQQATHTLKFSQLTQEFVLSQDNESEIPLADGKKEQSIDDFTLNEHVNICSLPSISEVISECTERCISLGYLRDKTISPENKCFYNIQANKDQQKTVIRNNRGKKDPDTSTSILGQLALADETHIGKDKSKFQNKTEKDLWSQIHSIQPLPQFVCDADNYSTKTTEAPHEDPSTYFWAPLADSSDEECAERIVMTKRSDRSGAEMQEHKQSSHSICSLKGKNRTCLSSALLGGSTASVKKTYLNEKWTVGEKRVLESKGKYEQKDFNLSVKAHGCSEGKFIADSIKGEAENRCIFVSSESEVENDELEDLVIDFTCLKKDTDQRNESRFKHVENSDSTVEARTWTAEEETHDVFSSTSFDKSMGKGHTYKRAKRELELKSSKKESAMQRSNPLWNSSVNHPENTFKVCPDCASLSYSDMTWCNGCAHVVLGVLTQSDKGNMQSKSKVFLGDVTDKEKNVSNQIIKSSQVSGGSPEESSKLRERSDDCQKLCRDDKPTLYSDCDSSVLDKYYFYLDQLNKSRCLHPKDSNPSFSFQEFNKFSTEEKINQHAGGKVAEQEETKEVKSDCGAEQSSVSNINPDALEQEGESTFGSGFMTFLDKAEESQVSIDRKRSETKRIRSKMTDSKRYWEKSSIAWLSYTHGELKPRSQCVQRPAAADVGKMVSISQNIHPSGTNSRQHCKSAFQCSEATVNWDGKGESDLSMWLLLPDELWLCIFSLFSHKELSRVAQVCHRFHRLARDESFWKQIQIADCHCLNDEGLINLGLHHPQCFTLYHCHDETQSITHRGLKKFFQHCRDSLKELNITSCHGPRFRGDTILLHASNFCSQLTSVDISWTGATDLGVVALAEASLSLQGFSANGCQLTNNAISALVEKHGKSLSKLEIFGCHALTAKCLSSMAIGCPNLQTLNIGRLPKVTNICLAKIVNCLKKLTALNLTGLNVVRDRVVHFIVTQCPRLECLVLSSCSQVTDISLVEISTYLQTIRYLDVSGCKKVTDIGIQALTGSCRQLYYLDLSSTRTSKRGVCLLASFCHLSLECVKLSFCKDVTLGAVKKLCKHCKRYSIENEILCHSGKKSSCTVVNVEKLKSLHLYGCHFMPDLESINKINKMVQVYHDLCVPPANN